jgi:hypothetical protein
MTLTPLGHADMKITRIAASALVIIATLVSLYLLLLYNDSTFMGMTTARAKDIWQIFSSISMVIFGGVNAVASWKSKPAWLKYAFLVVSPIFALIVVARLLMMHS